MPFRISAILTAVVLLAAFSGCGPLQSPTVPVRGIVTLDGQPVAGAAVLFTPEQGRPAEAITDASGGFVLHTFDKDDGAVPGNHKVTVTLSKADSAAVNNEGLENPLAGKNVQIQWIVPQKYSRPETSGLSWEVVAGMPPVRLELNSSK
jgi:hypothetical protein